MLFTPVFEEFCGCLDTTEAAPAGEAKAVLGKLGFVFPAMGALMASVIIIIIIKMFPPKVSRSFVRSGIAGAASGARLRLEAQAL